MPSKIIYTKISFIVLYVVLSLIKMSNYLLEGRFWAEEGKIFYSQFIKLRLIENIFFIFNGHLEMFTNIGVYLSTLVDLKYAPLITTYYSFLVQMMPIVYFILNYEKLNLKKRYIYYFIFILVGMPQGNEVWSNTINLHFHFTLMAALIFLMPSKNNLVNMLLLVMCGMSGIPANFMMPLFVYRYFKTRNNKELFLALSLIFTSLIQLILLWSTDYQMAGRSIPHLIIIPVAILTQGVLSPIFGKDLIEPVANILRKTLDGDLRSYFIFLMISYGIYKIINKHKKLFKGLYFEMIFVALWLLICFLLTSIGEKQYFISADWGGRYFYVSNALISLCFLNLMQYLFTTSSKLIRFGLGVFMSISVLSLIYGVLDRSNGPSWFSEVKKLQSNPDLMEIQIWPDSWSMNISNDKSQ